MKKIQTNFISDSYNSRLGRGKDPKGKEGKGRKGRECQGKEREEKEGKGKKGKRTRTDGRTDLQLAVVHAVGRGVELGVVDRVQQLDHQVTRQQLRHKGMLREREVRGQTR